MLADPSAVAANAGGSAAVVILLIVGILIAIAAYWTPTIVAWRRHVPNIGSIIVINFLLGWTLVGWAVALAMAVKTVAPPVTFVPPQSWGTPPPGYGPPQPQPYGTPGPYAQPPGYGMQGPPSDTQSYGQQEPPQWPEQTR